MGRTEADGDGDEGDGGAVDEGFIARALAESRRMRGEASLSHQKRADNAARLAARHGQRGAGAMAAAMAEHAAEVLSPEAAAAVGLAEGADDAAA